MSQKQNLLPVIALPPRGQRKFILGICLAVEAVAALSLILAHTLNIQNTAQWLLSISPNAFAAQNTTIIFQILSSLFVSLHIELLLLLIILSLRTVLVVRILTKDILHQPRWYLHIVQWKNAGWFLATVFLYYILLWLGFAALVVPVLFFAFLFCSWPIVYAANPTVRATALQHSLTFARSNWKRLIAPFILTALSQTAFFSGMWYALTELATITPIVSFPMLWLCLVGAEVGYLVWARFFTQVARDTQSTQTDYPRWIWIICGVGIGIIFLWAFTMIRSMQALNRDPVTRAELIYDVMPKAETGILANWQQQLQTQKELQNMTPEQSERLDQLINQMGVEYQNQASMSSGLQQPNTTNK